MPGSTAACVTVRARSRRPPPHVTEQGDHVAHAESTQSRAHGHAVTEHTSLSLRVGQGVPPHAASVVAVRDRERMPLPHDTEHADHDAHAETTHATGQQPRPQLMVSMSAGHGMPPFSAARVGVRVRDFVTEVPHVAEHADHAAHCDTWQSTGGNAHAGCVHGCDSIALPGHEPPHASAV